MSDNFVQFLISLSEDVQKLERFKENPDREMNEAGLDENEKNAIRTGNALEIRRLAGGRSRDSFDLIVVVAVILFAGDHD